MRRQPPWPSSTRAYSAFTIRQITVEDLLTFWIGFGLSLPINPAIAAAAEALEFRRVDPPLRHLPLTRQPGEVWAYDTGIRVLGALLERASSQKLDTLMRDRLLASLGMIDTGFHVTARQRDRVTTLYAPNAETGEAEIVDGVDCRRFLDVRQNDAQPGDAFGKAGAVGAVGRADHHRPSDSRPA